MDIYLAAVSRKVDQEIELLQMSANRLLSFYYEALAPKGAGSTKAFRIWSALKKDPHNLSLLDGKVAMERTVCGGVEDSYAEKMKRDRRSLPGFTNPDGTLIQDEDDEGGPVMVVRPKDIEEVVKPLPRAVLKLRRDK